MPAVIDDPQSPVAFRRSGAKPFPTSKTPFPAGIKPREVLLRDGKTKATVIPFGPTSQAPSSLLDSVRALLATVVEDGQTYPFLEPIDFDTVKAYWFGVLGAVAIRGDAATATALVEKAETQNVDWEAHCLGTFTIKPNYPGRSSHICNAGFATARQARGLGLGRRMGETYLEWAPLLGFTYSVFNLVYETNVASCRIWDGLGFQRIGRVPGCGNLKGIDHLVDAIIFGRELGPNHGKFLDVDGPVSPEREGQPKDTENATVVGK